MAPQPTRALVLVALLAACAGTRPRGGFVTKPEEADAERRCQSGSAAACGALGRTLIGERTNEDFGRGVVLLEIACGQDDLPACGALTEAYMRKPDSPRSLARAHDLAGRGCERRSAAACTQLAEVIGLEEGDEEERMTAFYKGCDLGDADGCERYGLTILSKRAGDRSAGEAALAHACEMGRLSSCHHLGTSRLAQAESGDDALALLVRACERGYVKSCSLLASMVAPLVSQNGDCARAVRFAAPACRGKDRNACAVLDACQLTNPQQSGPARERLRASCGDDGVPMACLYWADAEAAHGSPRQVLRAYEIACERGWGRIAEIACPRLSGAALAGARAASEVEAALARLRVQCEGASGEACCTLGEQYQTGRWVPADPDKARELRRKACSLGCERCCR